MTHKISSIENGQYYNILRKALCLFIGSVIFSPAICEADSPIAKAKSSVAWIQNFSCPQIGAPLQIKGVSTQEEIEKMKKENWTFAQKQANAIAQTTSSRNQVLNKISKKGGALSSSVKSELADLDGEIELAKAKTTTALVFWTLANLAELPKLSSFYPSTSNSPHPLANHLISYQQLNQFIKQTGGSASPIDSLNSIREKFHACLVNAQNQIAVANSPSINDAVQATLSPEEIGNILRKYDIAEANFSGPGVTVPVFITAVQNRQKELQDEARRIAEEKARAEQERMEKDAQYRYQVQLERAQKHLPIAQEFIHAISSRNQAKALELMHDNVSMSSPKGSYSGKHDVLSKLQSNQGGSPPAPYLSGTSILSAIPTKKGTYYLHFDFTDGLISRLSVTQ